MAVSTRQRRKRSIVSSARNIGKHKFRRGNWVLAQLFYDEGDTEWLQCFVLGCTGTPKNPTYNLRNYEGDRFKTSFPQSKMKRL